VKNEPIEVTLKVTQVFESLGIPYLIAGSLASPEDTILAKLEWYRMGGDVSDRQWRDILGVLKTRAGELDLDYLRKWAEELRVSDLLERALQESDSRSD
jgi:hypothetical protein